jgi:hypothetical protein
VRHRAPPRGRARFGALRGEARGLACPDSANDGNALAAGFGGQHLRHFARESVGIGWQLGRVFGERDALGDEGLRTVRALQFVLRARGFDLGRSLSRAGRVCALGGFGSESSTLGATQPAFWGAALRQVTRG